MRRIAPSACVLRSVVPAVALLSCSLAGGQQTLGNLSGTVTDKTGALLPGVQVQLTGEANGVSLRTTSSRNGTYQFQNLPVGGYTLVFARLGFETQRFPAVPVQESRTGTIDVSLRNGSESTTITVNDTPLLNQTDATNGYVLDAHEIQQTPLATGSFTQLAILTPGVSAELSRGIGSNAGLGNQPLWANGQRDTSNGFQVDGVDVGNLFNGKSSSQSTAGRLSFNIGQGAATAGESQTDTSVYGSNGQGLATPPPEFIQEISVNTSGYDSSQGNRSGAQIDVNTATGSNVFHGQGYGTRATNFANAAPYFNKQGVLYQQNLPYSFLVPQLHRDIAGGTFGGPIFRDKFFFFLGYEHQHVADSLKGYSQILVPYGLSDDRSQTGIQAAIDSYNAASVANKGQATTFNGTFDPVAVAILQQKLPSGGYLIPSAQNSTPGNVVPGSTNVTLQAPALFRADQATAAMDYNASSHDRVSVKYYFQHDPTVAPFTNANTIGYPAAEDSGAQVGSLTNAITIGSKVNWEQRFGFSRQKVYSTFQPTIPNQTYGINFPMGNGFPGVSLGHFAYSNGGSVTTGPNSSFANAGYFQNRWNPESNVVLSAGKHNITAGANFNYTQLNIRNRRVNQGTLSTTNFVTFVEGIVSSSSELLGASSRYYRSDEAGIGLQDQWRILPNLSLTLGVRYDYDGGFSEKYGNIFNFEPTLFSVTQSAVANSGFVVAGNNRFSPTAGVSNSTLTGRQWGISPRLGFAFTPKQNGGKVVFRGGFGTYFDRGEYFSYLSQPAGGGSSGPFGVTTAAPLVNQVNGVGTRTLENPLGQAVIPVSSSDPSTFNAKLPTANAIRAACTGLAVEQAGGSCGLQPCEFGACNFQQSGDTHPSTDDEGVYAGSVNIPWPNLVFNVTFTGLYQPQSGLLCGGAGGSINSPGHFASISAGPIWTSKTRSNSKGPWERMELVR